MVNSFAGCFNGLLSDKTAENVIEATKPTSFVYRDELDRKHPQNKISKQKAIGRGDLSAAPNPLNKKEGSETKKTEVVRVKIRMTKREAEKLLSKCRDGGVLDFRHVANQIVSIPVDRVNVTMMTSRDEGKAALDTIPEEV